MALQLVNRTPFTAQLLPMLETNGASVLRVVLKAGYEILDNGQLCRAEEQPVVVMADEYWGEPGRSSVRVETDVSLHKPYTDLLVQGEAIPIRGGKVRELEVLLRYQGRPFKRLLVTGDRRWERGLLGWNMTPPLPFDRMPLVYERAFGGADALGCEPRNRCGTGYASRLGHEFEGTAVPNIEFLEQRMSSPGALPTPAGLGPLAKSWEPRLSWAGTYDSAWLEDQFPLLPKNFDSRFNQSAPSDQWLPRPRGGERLEISGMRSEGPLHIVLPACQVRLLLRYVDRFVERSFEVDTIQVDTGTRLLTLTWRGTADIHGDPFRLMEIILEAPASAHPSGGFGV